MKKTKKTINEMQYFDFSLEPGKVIENRTSINSGLPLISVVTILSENTNNEYIKQMYNCLKNQTFPFWEWIIIVREKKKFLTWFNNDDKRIKIMGYKYETIAKAKYYAIKNSISDIIFNYEENDLLDKTMLECGFFTMYFNSEASFAWSKMVEFQKRKLLVNHPLNISDIKKKNIVSPGVFVRKEQFLKIDIDEEINDDNQRQWYIWLDLLSKKCVPLKMEFYGYWHRNLIQNKRIKEEDILPILKDKIKCVDSKMQTIKFENSYEVDYTNTPSIIDIDKKPIVPKDEKKRILFILPWSVVGGADLFNFNLIKGLKQKDYQISVITTQKCDYALRQGIEQYVEEYFDLTSFLKRRDWASFIAYIIKSRRINLVFLSNSYYGYYALPWLKCQFKDIPFVDYIHAENYTLRNGGFPKDSNAVADYLDATYTCTSHLREVMHKTMKRNKKNVKTVYIGTDPAFFDPSIEYVGEKELKEFYYGKKVILFPSRMVHYKRPLFAINVIKRMAEIRDDVRLAMIGDGIALEDVKQYIIENDLQNLVTCFGMQKDVRPFYKVANATIVCSLREGLTLTTYESLSMGVPVVSANIGGQGELIGKECGTLIDPYQTPNEQFNFNYSDEEIQKYADALLEIVDKEDNTNIKEVCREKILKKFSITKMVETLDREFTKHIETGSRVNKEVLKNVELAERYLMVHSVLESKDERGKTK